MRQYINELHKKPRHHKKRFALAVSGIVTLSIFALWSLVNLSPKEVVVRDTKGPVNLASVSEASSIENAIDTIKGSWSEFIKIFNE
jgi:hypothetical protein